MPGTMLHWQLRFHYLLLSALFLPVKRAVPPPFAVDLVLKYDLAEEPVAAIHLTLCSWSATSSLYGFVFGTSSELMTECLLLRGTGWRSPTSMSR